MVERYRLLDYEAAKEALEQAEKEWPRAATIDPNYRGNGLQLEFTVADPDVFTMPWSATITYSSNANQSWEERVCAEKCAARRSVQLLLREGRASSDCRIAGFLIEAAGQRVLRSGPIPVTT